MGNAGRTGRWRGFIFLGNSQTHVRVFSTRPPACPWASRGFTVTTRPWPRPRPMAPCNRCRIFRPRAARVRATAENIICIIPGRQRLSGIVGRSGRTGPTRPSCLVPHWTPPARSSAASAPGAAHALDAAALVELAGRMRRFAGPLHRRRRGTTQGDEWLFHGTRTLMDMLLPDKTLAQALDRPRCADSHRHRGGANAAAVVDDLGDRRWPPKQTGPGSGSRCAPGAIGGDGGRRALINRCRMRAGCRRDRCHGNTAPGLRTPAGTSRGGSRRSGRSKARRT